MRRAVQQALGSLSTYRYGVDSYDAAKLGLGPLMYQRTGAANEDKYAGPLSVAVARPMEQSTTIPSVFPWAMQWQNNAAGEIDWVFLADNAAAGATRRLNAYTFDRRTSLFTWVGFVTVTFPSATNFTVRALRMTYDLHTAGTVAVSGTAVTGTSTSWQTDKACVGNRIGFGSRDPAQISTWYEITAIGSDTGITLASSAGTIAGGTPYVIEDLRAVMACTNATTTNGGLFVCKGLNFNAFSNVGGTVPAAVSTDNIRACYWLKDAATVTNTVALGMGIAPKTSFSSQMVYVLDTIANPVVFKYNIRAALTVSSGADTTAFQFKTGSGGAVTGTASQANNGRLATAAHGPHSGVETLYFTTTTRVYAAPTAGITNGSTTWLSGGTVMTEVPPGGVNTFAAGALLNSIEFASGIDKFIICQNATAAPMRSYVTQYRTDGGQLDRVFGSDTRQIDQAAADASITPVPSMTGGPYSAWSEGGLCYLATIGTTAITNRLYAVPLSADWEYAATTGCRLITPEISTPDAAKFVSFFAQEVQILGTNGGSGKNLGLDTEAWRLYYRTTGISDNSGSWTLLDSTGVVNIAGATSVQLMFEFRIIGLYMLPARICNYGVIYDDTNTDEHWQFSSNVGTDLANKRFGFRHAVAYGSAIPRLKIELFDAESGASLGSDDSTTQAWTWAKSTNAGGAWGSYSTTDRANADTYVRVTPPSLADNIKVRAVLRHY